MAIVETEFDGILEEDVILEETDSTLETKDILKTAENIFKANLYLKELFTSAPVFNSVLKFDTIEANDFQLITPQEDTSLILFKNVKDGEGYLRLNGGIFVLLPFESFEMPVPTGQTLEIKGKISIVETKYV